MENIRTKSDILMKLEIDKKYYENYLTLLEKVKFCRKKDGTPFKNINQNFDGGKVIIESYSDSFHPVFQVCDFIPGAGYKDYTFDVYLYVDEMRKNNPEDARIKDVNDKNGCFRNTYLLTVLEIEQKIAQEKEKAKKEVENYEKQIERLETAFSEVKKMVEEIKSKIAENSDLRDNHWYPTSLEYALIEYVKNNISA